MELTEQKVREDLAAAYRAAASAGWNDTIYNHFTVRVPGESNHFLVKRHGDLFGEVTASSLIKIDLDGRNVSFGENVNPAAFAIHAAVFRANPEVNVTLHIHSPQGVALSARPEGFLFISQESAFHYERIAYYDFDGIEENAEDTAKLAAHVQDEKHTLILRNHGILCVGPTMPIAFIRLRYLLDCATQQLLALSGATPPTEIREDIRRHTRDQFEAQQKQTGFQPDWDAVVRRLERTQPEFRH